MSRRLVIDTNVTIEAAGEPDELPGPFRSFLEHVFGCCHQAVVTPEIEAEWEAHLSAFLRRWWTRMAKNGKIAESPSPHDSYFRALLDRSARGGAQRKTVAGDVHLVEAALAADRIIVSCERKARAAYGDLAATHAHFGHLRSINWVNPRRGHRKLAKWLEEGAERRPEFQLDPKA